MLTNIALIVFLLIALVLAYAASRPDDFRLERSLTIRATPEKIFALISDFHQWSQWSPWEKLDQDLKRSYSGNASGVGAAYDWEGAKAGVGRMQIIQSDSPVLVKIKLDFLKPMKAHNTAEFALQLEGELTRVTWAMYGRSPYLAKVMGVFFSIDKMVGKDFEAGLQMMKAVAEKPAAD